MNLKLETVKAIYATLEERHSSDEEYWKDLAEDVEKLKKATTDTEVVDAFINFAWDLPSFAGFIMSLDIPKDEMRALVGEATCRHREWST